MECSICLESIELTNNYVVTKCGHSFHCTCLISINGDKCPCCRSALSDVNANCNDTSKEAKIYKDAHLFWVKVYMDFARHGDSTGFRKHISDYVCDRIIAVASPENLSEMSNSINNIRNSGTSDEIKWFSLGMKLIRAKRMSHAPFESETERYLRMPRYTPPPPPEPEPQRVTASMTKYIPGLWALNRFRS